MAAIKGLSSLKRSCPVIVTTDSQYVRLGITQWIEKWKKQKMDKKEKIFKEIFDHDAFYSRIMNDIDVAKTVISTFLEDMPVQIEKLGKSIESVDFKAATQYAHRIRGAAANMNCAVLFAKATEAEKAATLLDATKLQELFLELQEDFKDITLVLEAIN